MGIYDEPGDPTPITEELALLRAEKCVEPIARFFMFMAMLLILPVLMITKWPTWLLAVMLCSVWYAAWVVLFRMWKSWAISRGCDREELELLGEESGILPARGSLLWYLQWPAHAP